MTNKRQGYSFLPLNFRISYFAFYDSRKMMYKILYNLRTSFALCYHFKASTIGGNSQAAGYLYLKWRTDILLWKTSFREILIRRPQKIFSCSFTLLSDFFLRYRWCFLSATMFWHLRNRLIFLKMFYVSVSFDFKWLQLKISSLFAA